MTHLTRSPRVVLVLLAVCLGGSANLEAFDTGAELGDACAGGTSAEQVVHRLRCLSYIGGFLDAYQLSMAVLEHQAPRAKKPICLPPRGVEKGQVMALVNDRLKRIPTEREQSARIVLFSVLATAYSCE
ncbi:MAG TPA: Rap1a/Tai family immunity protein [Candidatus Tectomicrobia bacterium]|nr:Rap1a/Tai family immunity protein [Candidatus Tectomicrobia bacterium]